jgi:hypothetical protein
VIRKTGITIVLCFVGVFAFAQTQPKRVLAMKDLDSFVENFEEITDIFDEYDEELGGFMDELSDLTGADLTAGFVKLRNSPVSAGLQTALAKQGMGSNAFEKIIVILYGLGLSRMENELEEMAAEKNSEETDEDDGISPADAFIMEQVSSLKKAIHTSDLSLIASRLEDFLPLIQ